MELSHDFSLSSLQSSERNSDFSITPRSATPTLSEADVEAFARVMEGQGGQGEGEGAEDGAPLRGEERATDASKITQEDPNVPSEKGALRGNEGELRKLFERSLVGKEKSLDTQRKTDAKSQVAHNQDAALIESLFKGMSMPGDVQKAPPEGIEKVAASAAQLDAENLETLVSRILVNTPEKGASEVRLTLHDNLLKGAEISIKRDLSGNLSISLSTKDPAVFQTLVGSRTELLESLEKSERGTVSVEVRDDSSDEGDMQRRSRGLDGLEEQV